MQAFWRIAIPGYRLLRRHLFPEVAKRPVFGSEPSYGQVKSSSSLAALSTGVSWTGDRGVLSQSRRVALHGKGQTAILP